MLLRWLTPAVEKKDEEKDEDKDKDEDEDMTMTMTTTMTTKTTGLSVFRRALLSVLATGLTRSHLLLSD